MWLTGPNFKAVKQIANIKKAKETLVGGGKLLILKDDGSVWEWDAYRDRNANDDYNALQIDGLSDITALSSGQSTHYFAIKKDGTVWGWGRSSFGSIGLSNIYEVSKPALIKNLTNVTSITTSMFTTHVLKEDGTVWTIGADLASDSPMWNASLRRVEGLENVVSIAMGHFHALALTKDGKLVAWGQNRAGQLGDNSFKNSPVPIPVKLP
ncbi:Regulator of chromosome condensation (RCC1) repeat protein [compost metagenome]